MNIKPKPVGKCTAVAFEMRRPANDKAVFVSITCKDEAGNTWNFAAACFCFELKPGAPTDSK